MPKNSFRPSSKVFYLLIQPIICRTLITLKWPLQKTFIAWVHTDMQQVKL